MSKLEMKNMDFCPPRKWLAIKKATGEIRQFTFDDVLEGMITSDLQDDVLISDCHLYGFTGYCTSKLGTSGNSKGEEVYGGQLCRRVCHGPVMHTEAIGVVEWRDYSWVLRCNHHIAHLERIPPKELTIIGHIHCPNEWSKEVAELLK
jgi:hypothetical protein